MARKINPDLFRLGINVPWTSRWFYKKNLKHFLEEDCIIYKVMEKELPRGSVADISIERTRQDVKIIIKSNKPGFIIGRKGATVEQAKKNVLKNIKKLRKEHGLDNNFSLDINVLELKRTDVSAKVVAEQLAMDLEKRLPFRTVMKSHLRMMEQNRDIKGAKIRASGRLNGVDIARSEWIDFGKMPLSTLRSHIDYAEAVAKTTYGAIGVRVWIYKGEVFEDEETIKS